MGIDTRANAEAVAKHFDKLYRLDPACVRALFRHSAVCNEAVADSPDFVVRGGVVTETGILGIINGMFSPSHRVAIKFNAETREPLGFAVVDATDL